MAGLAKASHTATWVWPSQRIAEQLTTTQSTFQI